MSVRILRNPLDFAYATETIYDPTVHMILPWEPEWLRSFRIWTKQKHLFVMIHKITGNLVLAQWLFRPFTGSGRGLIGEIKVIQKGEVPCIMALMRRLVPESERAAWMRKKKREQDTMFKILREDSVAQAQSAAKWMAKNNLEDEAKLLLADTRGYIGDREAAAQAAHQETI